MLGKTEFQTFTLTLLRDVLTVAAWTHRQDPYRYLTSTIAVLLALTPYLGNPPKAVRISSITTALTLSLISSKQFRLKAEERERQQKRQKEAEDDRQFIRQMQRGLLEELKTIQVEAQLRKAELEEYDGLPLWIHPYGRDIAKFDQQKADPVKDLLDGMMAGLDKVLGEPIDVAATTSGDDSVLPATTTATVTPNSVIAGFAELDLAGEAAKSDKSLLLSAQTGIGKTSFLRHFIHAVHKEYEGLALFDILDFKGITGHYCGLERTQYYVKSGASGANFDRAMSLINGVIGMLDSRKAEIPYYFLSDEINNGLEQSKAYRPLGEDGKPLSMPQKPEEMFRSSLKFIVTQGRERLIRGVFTAHGNLMTLLGIDGDTAQSLICAVLGRKLDKGDGFALISRMLDRNGVFFSAEERKRLGVQFQQIKAIAEQNGRTIALTNIQGSWEFVFLPAWYATDPGLIEWEPQNQSITKLITSTPSTPPPIEPIAPSVPTVSLNLDSLTPIQQQVLTLLTQAETDIITPDELFLKLRPDLHQWQWNQTIAELAKLGAIQLIGASQIRLLVRQEISSNESTEELTERQRSLLEWSHGKGWLSPSKLQSDFRLFRDTSNEEIISDFKSLTAAGYGEIREKHGTVQWCNQSDKTPDIED